MKFALRMKCIDLGVRELAPAFPDLYQEQPPVGVMLTQILDLLPLFQTSTKNSGSKLPHSKGPPSGRVIPAVRLTTLKDIAGIHIPIRLFRFHVCQWLRQSRFKSKPGESRRHTIPKPKRFSEPVPWSP